MNYDVIKTFTRQMFIHDIDSRSVYSLATREPRGEVIDKRASDNSEILTLSHKLFL